MDDRQDATDTTDGKTRLNPKSPREALAPEQAPPLPRSRRARNPIVVVMNALVTLLLLGVLAAGVVLYWGKREFEKPGPLTQEKVVVIPADSGLVRIADILETEGVIETPYDMLGHYIFVGGVRAYQQQGRLKAGEYAFPAGISMRGVMNMLVSGKAIMHQITFPEGLTSQQIVDRLKDSEFLTGPVPTVPAEGTLLPETYSFTRGASRSQIIEQMKTAHAKVLDEIWAGRSRDLPFSDPKELVTLASIVEKETGKADERPHVASVFLNRLAHNMRLQSDPTIIYGLVGGAGTLGRPITRTDIDKQTPYNTYHINGLPPGPIANPGRAALEAVANPSNTKDVYFVADGTGGHIFAASLADHNRNVAKWRKVEREKAAAGKVDVDTKDPDAVDLPPDAESDTPSPTNAKPADPNDLLDGEAPRDPKQPILPQPKPE
ncbi:endolytic transglycosylase MltG [Pleomorphomonas oryzae]|uniref:endolytic transglycosylase MltG n=1 Tax=Pleomorphomonas oryzae TaxID=261934 RepID=UPI00040E6DB9|nr:endolytic transglycosylase MltG [Pleomorphomonas oryzae]